MSPRRRIEAAFESYGHWVARWRFAVLVASLAFAAVMSSGVRLLTADVSFENFLYADDPIRRDYDAFRDRFGREDAIVVTIATRDVFDPAFLERLRAFHAAAIELPHVEDVTSLINARDTRGEADVLIVEDLIGDEPLSAEALARTRARALANPLYRYNVVSPDARFTNVRIDLDTYSSIGQSGDVLAGFDADTSHEKPAYLTTAETDAFAIGLHALVDASSAPGFELYPAGLAVMLYDISQALARDMQRFVASAIAIIAILLFVIFRRPVGVILPIVVVGLSVASTLGLMGHIGTPIHIPTQILPSMLLAIGVGDSVHILTIFFRARGRGAAREDALAHALGHSGLPVLLTSLTTAGGLVSFAGVGLAPVAALALYAPAGVMFALLFSLTLLPALLAIVPVGTHAADANRENQLDRILVSAGRFATRNPRATLGAAGVLCLIAAGGVPRLHFSHNPPHWLADDDPTRRAIELVDREMGGAMTVEVIVEGDGEGSLRSPALLSGMARLGDILETESHEGLTAGQTVSLSDIVKEIHRALNEGRDAYYVVPQDARLIAQELLLFESSGSDDLEDQVDSLYSQGRISVRLPWFDAIRYVPFLDALQARAEETLPEARRISVAGNLPILARTIRAMVFGIVQSYGLALLIITPLMALLLGSLRLGLYAMVPNLVPILLTLGMMGWLGIPIDAFTMMTGGIALGLVVDDTIHFMHNFARYHALGGRVEPAVRDTLQTTGRAITITSLVIGCGFLVFMLSSMHNLVTFGQVITFAVSAALVADIMLAPALMALVMPDAGSGTEDRRG